MSLRSAALVVCALVALGSSGCAGSEPPSEVVLVTHDSFAVSKDVLGAFEEESGLTVRVLQGGDTGAMTNTALLTAGDPQGDVIFGIDDNLVSRVVTGELLDDYVSGELEAVDPAFPSRAGQLTPIDHGEVCLNADRSAFGGNGLPPLPVTLDDLTDPQYKGMLVVENPATSSPGLAFLLATVARFGEKGYLEYWRRLVTNDVLVVDGWEEAYTQQFSGAGGSPGRRPLVVSYATSPAAEVIFAGKQLEESPTVAIEDGCFRQVEYAGVLRGAANPEGARTLIDFMLSARFQADVPGSMFVYPVRTGVALPVAFTRHAIAPRAPLSLPPDEIAAGRDRWVAAWTDVALR
ncbi:MAG: thiamine ABC transporter substrate binding subunit [Gaiella sp.]